MRFQCMGSGECCTAHGEYNRVYLEDSEARVAARLLGIGVLRFEELYCVFEEGDRQLDMSSGVCPMLKDRRCQIYPARPVQCRTWPFWRSNLKRTIWHREIAPFCKGVGQGRLHPLEEIEACAEELEAHEE
ncbi:MAG: YkgJ family cysteine cluster protein [Planctomycetota bacterium]